MERFTALDLQRHVAKVQHAAMAGPVAITHHGRERLVMMEYEKWRAHGRGDALADTIKRLQANRSVLRREGIAGVSVFGSVARGDAREDSDVDLLIEPAAGTSVSGLRLVRWKTLMSELLGRDADVVVREFLEDKVRETMERDLIEVVFNRAADVGDAA
jgi:predicted nucleotidyltransferase